MQRDAVMDVVLGRRYGRRRSMERRDMLREDTLSMWEERGVIYIGIIGDAGGCRQLLDHALGKIC